MILLTRCRPSADRCVRSQLCDGSALSAEYEPSASFVRVLQEHGPGETDQHLEEEGRSLLGIEGPFRRPRSLADPKLSP